MLKSGLKLSFFFTLIFGFSHRAFSADPLVQNMSPNEKVVLNGIEFEVQRMESPKPDEAAFDNEAYKVSVGKDGKLYVKNRYKEGNVLLSTQILPHAAQFIVDKDGDLYVFHNTTLNTDYDRAFLFSEPEIIASGSRIVHEGKILAMTPLTMHGSEESSLIRYMHLLRKKGYEEFPLILGESDSAFSAALKYYKEHGFEKDFYLNFIRTFSKHLENVDVHLVPREGSCRAGLLKGYKGRLLRI
ncbi:MAG: hypothetical protein R3A80_07360 [Bdellovibrionota bacterium]